MTSGIRPMSSSVPSGAAGAQPRHEMRDLVLGLLPDLRRGAQVMRARVRRIAVLIDVEIAAGLLIHQAAQVANRPVAALERVGVDQLRAVGLDDALARR